MSRLMLHQIKEPKLRFGHNQALEDPRDGLTLFGPLDEGTTYGVRPGVIGTPDGVRRFWRWVDRIQRPIDDQRTSRPPFPGFEAAFNVPFSQKRVFEVAVNETDLIDACHIDDRHQRVHRVARLYADPIKQAVRDESKADVWFVVVPEEVYTSCRPESVIPKDVRIPFDASLSKGITRTLRSTASLFEELNDDATPYRYQPHFHNQLKALLLDDEVPTQILRESTIAPTDFLNPMGYPKRKVGLPSEIAWNLCTTAYYKSGARPWKLADVRPGVCYLGIVFKLDESGPDHSCPN